MPFLTWRSRTRRWHLGKMLSFVAFACAAGELWKGAVAAYAGTTPSRRTGFSHFGAIPEGEGS